MIELRWIEREEESQACGEVSIGHRVRVLQYRDARYELADRLTGEPVYTGSDWQDVPLVTDAVPSED